LEDLLARRHRAMTPILGDAGSFGAIWQLHAFALSVVLGGGAGIRATVPLFIMSLVHLFSPDEVPLLPGTEWLGYWYICVGLGILLVLEILADMIPAVDNCLHTVLTPAYPVAGALAAAAPDYGGGLATHVPMAVVGAGLAFAVHGSKVAARVTSHASSGGIASPVVSGMGTVVLVITVVVAIFTTVLAIIFSVGFIALSVWGVRVLLRAREKRRLRRAEAAVQAAVRVQQAAARANSGIATPSPLDAAEAGEAREVPLVAASTSPPAEPPQG